MVCICYCPGLTQGTAGVCHVDWELLIKTEMLVYSNIQCSAQSQSVETKEQRGGCRFHQNSLDSAFFNYWRQNWK